jgi:DNA-binding beta-propeller fold protein YncE
VSRIDPTTNTLTATITVSSSAVSGGDIAAVSAIMKFPRLEGVAIT